MLLFAFSFFKLFPALLKSMLFFSTWTSTYTFCTYVSLVATVSAVSKANQAGWGTFWWSYYASCYVGLPYSGTGTPHPVAAGELAAGLGAFRQSKKEYLLALTSPLAPQSLLATLWVPFLINFPLGRFHVTWSHLLSILTLTQITQTCTIVTPHGGDL